MTPATWHRAVEARLRMRHYITPELLNTVAVAFPDYETTPELHKKYPGHHPAEVITAAFGLALEDGETWFVDDEMVDVVEAGLAHWPGEKLLATDIPATEGIIYFERSVYCKDKHGKSLAYRGAVWTTRMPFQCRDSETDEISEPETTLFVALLGHGEDEDNYSKGIAALKAGPESGSYLRGLHWYTFDYAAVGSKPKATQPSALLLVLWRIAHQMLGVKYSERNPRSFRRDLDRWGMTDSDTVVVRLRRRRHEHGEPQGEANYSHRFIVSGHWRNQWYPSMQEHRLRWIAPFVKGPEDMPLVVKQRVVVVER
jgi:hypothetical protein